MRQPDDAPTNFSPNSNDQDGQRPRVIIISPSRFFGSRVIYLSSPRNHSVFPPEPFSPFSRFPNTIITEARELSIHHTLAFVGGALSRNRDNQFFTQPHTILLESHSLALSVVSFGRSPLVSSSGKANQQPQQQQEAHHCWFLDLNSRSRKHTIWIAQLHTKNLDEWHVL